MLVWSFSLFCRLDFLSSNTLVVTNTIAHSAAFCFCLCFNSSTNRNKRIIDSFDGSTKLRPMIKKNRYKPSWRMVVSGTPNSADNEDGYDIVYVVVWHDLSFSVSLWYHPSWVRERELDDLQLNQFFYYFPSIHYCHVKIAICCCCCCCCCYYCIQATSVRKYSNNINNWC